MFWPWRIAKRLTGLTWTVDELRTEVFHMITAIDALNTSITNLIVVVNKAVDDLQTLNSELQAALAANDPAAITAAAGKLDALTASLTAIEQEVEPPPAPAPPAL